MPIFDTPKRDFEELLAQLKHYLSLQKELTLVQLTEKLTKLLAAGVWLLLCFIFASMIVFYLMNAFAHALGDHLHNLAYGYLIVAGILCITLFIAYIQRHRWITNPILRYVCRLILPERSVADKVSKKSDT